MRTTLLAVLFSCAASVAAAQAPAPAACDRDCLRGLLTQYFDSLVTHDPRRLPLAERVRFTEDTVETPLGGGLWKSATRVRPYRQDFLDVRQGVAAAFAVVEESGSPSLVAVRLQAVNRRVTEIETMVVRSRAEGVLFEPDALQTPDTAMTAIPSPSQRQSRDEMVRIAALYPAGLRAGSFVKVDVPFAPGAYRFENGRRMAGPGCTLNPPSCEDIKGQRIPTLPETKERLLAVDEEAGLVLFRLDFGAGSVPQKEMSLTPWEAFKVYDGRIHAVEAIMEQMPRGASHGWE